MFSGEYTVEGTTWNGVGFSLFAPAYDVEVPTEHLQSPIEGQIRVQIVEEKGELVLVMLPRQTLENGRYVTVTRHQLREHSPQAA
jgi:hypothetical protein